MDFRLLPLCEEDIADYKKDMRKAFQMGAGSEFGKSYEVTNHEMMRNYSAELQQ